MKVVDSPLDLQEGHTYFRVPDLVYGTSVYLKLEGLNPAGSIKLKTAINMISDLEERGVIRPGSSRIVESSSGNLGVALSLVCKVKGYDFTCVTDPNASQSCIKYMTVYGARVITVTERDENGGFLNTRIRLIQKMLKEDRSLIWTNQYANQANPDAHARMTAREVLRDFPNLGTLFVGAGTTGTLMGCTDHFRKLPRRPMVVAIDAQGSVTFGLPAGRRYIPGLGTSRKPEIFRPGHASAFLAVSEVDTVRMAQRMLSRHGLLVGGSTATVLCGVVEYARGRDLEGPVVAISPDFGDKYIDTIFNPAWVAEKLPAALMDDMLDEPPSRIPLRHSQSRTPTMDWRIQ